MANNIFDLLNGTWGDTPPAPPTLQDLRYNLSNIRFDQFPTINTDSTFRVNALPEIKTISSLSLSIINLPFGYSIKLGFLGLEMFSFSMKGELKVELDDL